MNQPERLRIYICEPTSGAFHRHLGMAELHHGKVIELTVADRNAPIIVDAFNKVRIELTARSLVGKPVKVTHGSCGQCGCREFRQPYGMSSMIECNQCGAQLEQGGEDQAYG